MSVSDIENTRYCRRRPRGGPSIELGCSRVRREKAGDGPLWRRSGLRDLRKLAATTSIQARVTGAHVLFRRAEDIDRRRDEPPIGQDRLQFSRGGRHIGELLSHHNGQYDAAMNNFLGVAPGAGPVAQRIGLTGHPPIPMTALHG